MANPAGINNPPPSFATNFNIKLPWWNSITKANSQTQITNPSQLSNTPFIPQAANNFIYPASFEFLSPSFNEDTMVVILTNLDLKSLLICSEVNKSIYAVTIKTWNLWNFQFCSFLSNVKPITDCKFNPYQQFQIIYNDLRKSLKPFIIEFKHNATFCTSLTEPNGTLEKLQRRIERAGGIEAAKRIQKVLMDDDDFFDDNHLNEQLTQMHKNKDFKAWTLYSQLHTLKQNLYELTGQDNEADFAPFLLPDDGPIQMQLLRVINFLGPEEYNNQPKYDEVIEKSLNASSTPSVEEVKDPVESQSSNPASSDSHS